MSDATQIYSAEPRIRQTGEVIRTMLSNARSSMYLAYRLTKRDIKSDYSKSAMGMLWDFLDPLVLGAIFTALMYVRIINPGERLMPYAVYVIYGLLIYQSFREGSIIMTGVLQRTRGLLSQVKLPPEGMILSVFFRVMFNSFFRYAVLLFFSLLLRFEAESQGLRSFSVPGFGAFLVLFPLVIVSGMAIGLFLAPYDAIYSDVSRVLRIVLNPLRYITPVLWPLPDEGLFRFINQINPITPLVNDMRLLAVYGRMEDPVRFILTVAGFLILFVVSWFIFHLSIPILSDRA